jgi:hypothetical protein
MSDRLLSKKSSKHSEVDQGVEVLVKRVRKPLAEEVAGDCDLCNRYSSKLMEGVCVPCRGKYKIRMS